MGLFSSLKRFFGFKVEEPGPELQTTAVVKKPKPRKKNPSTKKRETKRKQPTIEVISTVEADPLLEESSSVPEAHTAIVEIKDTLPPKPKKPRKPRKPRKPKPVKAEKTENEELTIDTSTDSGVVSNNAVES